MKRALCNKNFILILLALFILLACSFITAENASAATIGVVYGTEGDGLYVRSGPGSSYGAIDAIWDGDEVTILEKTGNWYKITYDGITGYANADFIKVKEDKDYVYNEDFEKTLDSEGFPESYKSYLRKLHANHPEWVFKAQQTGIKWDDAVAKESVVSINLVHKSADDSWKSREYGAVDSKGNYVEFDSGGWVAASSGIIKYYMDPRNFLTESSIFQFMSHSYDAKTQTKSGLQDLVAGTFLANKFPEPGYDTYSDALIYAAKTANANPYVLASMILVEQGANGQGGSISGKVPGYEGYYNYFNVRAYASGKYDAVEYGLLYAKGSGDYGRPWNSRIKSIIGGALHYATGYINNNQNTLYLKKFNVMNGLSEVATHQYMTNVAGAAQEASNLKEGYKNEESITFYIPVYKNMPAAACAKPNSGNNDYFLKSLKVSGFDLLPAFNMYTENYEVVVPSDTTSINVNAIANNSASKVTGAGNVKLTGNTTNVKVIVTASSGATKTYTISVAKKSNGVSEEKMSSSVYKISNYITGVGYNTSVKTFASNITVSNGCKLVIQDKNGKEVTSGNVGTGMQAVLYKNNKAVKSVPVVIKGDNNGDGKLSSADVLFAQRYIIKTYSLSGAYFEGADVNGDGKVSSVDVLFMQRHIIGTYTIKQ